MIRRTSERTINRSIVGTFIAILVLSLAPGAGAQPSSSHPGRPEAATAATDDLAGLWKAKRLFGPDARGTLVVQRNGETYIADMAGRIVPVATDREELSFELPNGKGSFRGRLLAEGTIHGHWFPPASSAELVGFRFASPVELKPDGPNRWTGQVVPFDDEFTFYLMLRKRSDGSLSAFLHNVDRDWGSLIGVERLVRDGTNVKLMGKRPTQKEERVLAGGTWDAGNQVITLNFPSRGGSYDFQRDDDDSAFYPRGRKPGRYFYRPPLKRDDGWPTDTLESADIDRAGIEAFVQWILDMPMESSRTPQIDGVLIARHGKLVFEEYFHDQTRDRLHDTRSAAKVLTATIAGAAMQAGAPLSLTTPVYRIMNGGAFPAGLEPRKRAMTLEHLLTMSSGLFCDDTNPDAPGNENTMLDESSEPDYYRYTLKVPMASGPGEMAVYCSANANLALGVVGRATGEFQLDTFDQLIGVPMGIRRYGWFLDPAGHPYGGGGVQLLPRDFMKFGQLMLNGGTWEGHRILGRDFVARASAALYHLRNIYYGYFWWGIDYPYKDRTVHAFFAGGAGGQGVMVIPALDLVIAIFAGNYGDRDAAITVQQNLIPRYILPAVREPGDEKNVPVKPRDYTSPYGKSAVSGPVTGN